MVDSCVCFCVTAKEAGTKNTTTVTSCVCFFVSGTGRVEAQGTKSTATVNMFVFGFRRRRTSWETGARLWFGNLGQGAREKLIETKAEPLLPAASAELFGHYLLANYGRDYYSRRKLSFHKKELIGPIFGGIEQTKSTAIVNGCVWF